MKNNTYFAILYIFLLFVSCNQDTPSENIESQQSVAVIESKKQLNITILLDLSDRIKPTKYPSKPEHFERDIEIVKYFTELFKSDMEAKGALGAKGKMKVIFSPLPEDPEINDIAANLKVDLASVSNSNEKKEVFDNITSNFSENLNKIYTKTIETDNYVGSDTWRFFKNDVVDYCVEEDGYRNILVLITDGYLYHINSTQKSGNRTQYLLPSYILEEKLNLIGDSEIVKERIEKYDYGYITTRTDLNNLEILVLEINPTPNRIGDEDVISEYLAKWFQEMGVRDENYKIYNSDLPEYTKTRIDNFISN